MSASQRASLTFAHQGLRVHFWRGSRKKVSRITQKHRRFSQGISSLLFHFCLILVQNSRVRRGNGDRRSSSSTRQWVPRTGPARRAPNGVGSWALTVRCSTCLMTTQTRKRKPRSSRRPQDLRVHAKKRPRHLRHHQGYSGLKCESRRRLPSSARRPSISPPSR